MSQPGENPASATAQPAGAPQPPVQPQPQPQKQDNALDDPIMEALATDLQDLIRVEKGDIAPAPEPKPEHKPAAAPEAAKPAAELPPLPPPKVAVKKRQDPAKLAAEAVDKRIDEIKAASATPEPKPDAKPEDYSQEQLDELADAEYAEASNPGAFKGMKDKLKSFYSKVDGWVSEREKDPEWSFDPNDDEFKEFIQKNHPSWNGQRERLRIERIADARAEEKFKARDKETNQRLDAAQREAREAKFMPAIEHEVSLLVSDYDKDTTTDDPLEKEIFTSYRDASAELASDYLRIVNGIDTMGSHNPPHITQRHNFIVGMVMDGADKMAALPANQTERNGKRFVTPTEFAKLQKEQSPKLNSVYTLGYKDVLKLLKGRAVEMAKNAINIEVEKAKSRGFVRTKPSSNTNQANQPKPMNPTKATVTPAPGVAQTSDSIDVVHPGIEVAEALGLR